MKMPIAIACVAAFLSLASRSPAQVACIERLAANSPNALERAGAQVDYWNGRAIVGVPDADPDGRALIFENIAGTWTEVADIAHPFPTGNDDSFGEVVSIFGRWAVIGAPFEGAPGFQAPGSTYVYRRSAAGDWTFFQELDRVGVTSNNDRFGSSVAIDGDFIAVGALRDDTAGFDDGAVYIFRFTGTDWVFEQKLVSSGGQAATLFGAGIGLDQGRLVVGAPYEDYLGFTSVGAAYIFERQPNTTWLEVQRLPAEDPADNSFFGISVDLSIERLVVGSEGVAVGGFSNVGLAYVYLRLAANNWIVEDVLEPNPLDDLTFGQQVTIRENRVLVNARRDGLSAPGSGVVYSFQKSMTSSAWAIDRYIFSPNAAAFDNFGQGVALGDEIALIGSPGDDSTMQINAGAAYLYDLGVADCNGNGIPDSCDLVSGAAQDCNGNEIPDSCDIVAGTGTDCDADGVLDSCQIAADPTLDCNGDGVLDVCQLSSMDCNNNGEIDICEIAAGTAEDRNGNMIPDECEDDLGIVYCSPNAANSFSPSGGRLSAIGSAALAANDVLLIASDLPSQKFGLFLNSSSSGFVPMAGGSLGALCLSGQIGRFNSQVASTGQGHELVLELDNQNIPRGGAFVPAMAGDRYHFQCWHRDVVSSSSVSNYTEGIWIEY